MKSDLITKKPLYDKIDISNMPKTEILDILFYKGPIDCFCPYCDEPSIFVKISNGNQGIREKALAENSFKPDTAANLFDKPEIFHLDFSCSRDPEHILNIIYKVEKKTIVKIGQSPSLFDIQKNDFKKYRKTLGNNFIDLHRALLFYYSNFGVASFTHFRRIIENYFLKNAYEIKRQQTDWNDTKYKESRFVEKLDILKDSLPKTLIENPRLYSIVSKGIHELEEEECLLFFEAIKECIFSSLDDIIEENRKRKSQAKIKSELSRIDNKISNK